MDHPSHRQFGDVDEDAVVGAFRDHRVVLDRLLVVQLLLQEAELFMLETGLLDLHYL